jgi:hypothetical protein
MCIGKRDRSSAPKINPIEWSDVRAESVAYDTSATIFSQALWNGALLI